MEYSNSASSPYDLEDSESVFLVGAQYNIDASCSGQDGTGYTIEGRGTSDPDTHCVEKFMSIINDCEPLPTVLYVSWLTRV